MAQQKNLHLRLIQPNSSNDPSLYCPHNTRTDFVTPSSEVISSFRSSSRTPTPKADCLSDIILSNTSYPTSTIVKNWEDFKKLNAKIEKPNGIFERLVASTRSPVAWPPRRAQGPSVPHIKPAFVYCGPGSRRVPGMSGVSIANPTTAKLPQNFQSESISSDQGPCSETEKLILGENFDEPNNDDGQVTTSMPARTQSAVTAKDISEQTEISIQAVGDETSTPPAVDDIQHGDVRQPQDNLITQNSQRPLKSKVTEHESITAVWRGPEYILEKSSPWWVVTDVSNASSTSDDVSLMGLILNPATYLKFKDGCAKSVLVEPSRIFGIIRVRNHAFEKSVTVRASHDKWVSFVDQPAVYVTSIAAAPSSEERYDLFAFRSPLLENCEEFEFAIHYRWWNTEGGGSCWDNNNGQNYLLRQRKDSKSLKVTEEINKIGEPLADLHQQTTEL